MPTTSIAIPGVEEWLEMRRHDVTASDSAALYGEHPYKTAYGLFREKRNAPEARIEENALMRRGKDCEPIIRSKLMNRFHDWRFSIPFAYLRDPEHRLGCTPDLYATDPDDNFVVIQLKTVNPYQLKRAWVSVPPKWILLQNLVEISLADADYGLIVAFDVDAWEIREPYRVDRFPEVEREIAEKALAFMTAVDNDAEPPPDFARDGNMLAARFIAVAAGKTIDLRADNRMPELCRDYLKFGEEFRELSKKFETVKSELRFKLGDAAIAQVEGFEVTNKIIHKRGYTVEPSSYPRLHVKED